ncbi:MAG: DUF1559 domain-containing protein [Planctomycetaceae bacterium]
MSMPPNSPYSEPVSSPPVRGTNPTKIVLIVLAVLLGLVLVCGGILAALLLPAVTVARQSARQMQSKGHLKQIALALHNYHDVYGSLPPAYTTDANGNPLHSWRVLLLPYLEERPLYDRFDLTQPWDSPANRALAQPMPEVYQSPLYGQPGSDQTHYLTVRDPRSAFPDSSGVRFDDLTDGIANTLVVAELANKTVIWTQPDDAQPADLYTAINAPESTGVVVVLADGSVSVLSPSTPQDDLDAMMTRNGGEALALP